MKKIIIIFLFITVFIISFSEFNVLIINSYSPNYDWTSEMNKGIVEVFRRNNISYYNEYLDAKTNFSALYIKHFQDLMEEKYRGNNIDIIITTDKEAFEFVHVFGDKTFGEITVAFAGVESVNKEYLKKYKNYFGLYGDIEIRDTVNQALRNHKDIENIISVFTTDSIGGNYSEQFQQQKTYFFNKNLITISARNTQEAIEKINAVQGKSIVLIGNVIRDKTYDLITLEKAANKISNNIKFPSYALWSNQIGNGVIGGNVSNPYKQGIQIAELVVKKLEGVEVPQFNYKEFQHMYDYTMLEKYQINTNNLPRDSIIINSPSIADNITEIIYITVTLIVILVIIIAIFTRYTLKLSKEKKQYEIESHQDTLTKVYNRRYLEKTEKDWVEESVIVFVFDVDYLKPINDTYGHDVGDRYIIKTAELLKNTFRNQDIISRTGGDEFIALIKTKPEEIDSAIRRILYTLELHLRSLNRDLDPKLSISYGYAVKEISFEEALKEADENMYKNKRNKQRK